MLFRSVEQALNNARALAFPSLWYETYGLVVTEAAARGVPSIVSDVSAAAERIRHGVSGWIFESGNVEALADCLRSTSDVTAVRAIGARAYEDHWSAPSDPPRHVADLVAIYERTLAASRA